MSRAPVSALLLTAAALSWVSPARAQSGPEPNAVDEPGGAEARQPQRGGYGRPRPSGEGRWRPDPPPRSADDARDPRIEKTMREAPPLPPTPPSYRGRDGAIKAAHKILKTVPTFINFRATIYKATWRVDPAQEWRVRPLKQCLTDLQRQRMHVKRWRPEDAEGVEGEEEALDPTPGPVFVRSPVDRVHFRSAHGSALLVSCELASRLPLLAKIVARQGVDQVLIVSAYRPRPRTSFHTMGLALDITRMHLIEPARGPRGELSPWLNVFSDFLETPELDTCDPSLFAEDSPLGDNERGRRLLKIACDLHASGAFSSVLTPNYNPGHRDHFHVDIRPDDPRLFLR